jgi:hypothetical protein
MAKTPEIGEVIAHLRAGQWQGPAETLVAPEGIRMHFSHKTVGGYLRDFFYPTVFFKPDAQALWQALLSPAAQVSFSEFRDNGFLEVLAKNLPGLGETLWEDAFAKVRALPGAPQGVAFWQDLDHAPCSAKGEPSKSWLAFVLPHPALYAPFSRELARDGLTMEDLFESAFDRQEEVRGDKKSLWALFSTPATLRPWLTKARLLRCPPAPADFMPPKDGLSSHTTRVLQGETVVSLLLESPMEESIRLDFMEQWLADCLRRTHVPEARRWFHLLSVVDPARASRPKMWYDAVWMMERLRRNPMDAIPFRRLFDDMMNTLAPSHPHRPSLQSLPAFWGRVVEKRRQGWVFYPDRVLPLIQALPRPTLDDWRQWMAVHASTPETFVGDFESLIDAEGRSLGGDLTGTSRAFVARHTPTSGLWTTPQPAPCLWTTPQPTPGLWTTPQPTSANPRRLGLPVLDLVGDEAITVSDIEAFFALASPMLASSVGYVSMASEWGKGSQEGQLDWTTLTQAHPPVPKHLLDLLPELPAIGQKMGEDSFARLKKNLLAHILDLADLGFELETTPANLAILDTLAAPHPGLKPRWEALRLSRTLRQAPVHTAPRTRL